MKITESFSISDDFIITTHKPIAEATESFGETYFRHLKTHSAKTAQICAETGRRDTFADLLQRCVRTALHLSDRKITQNDIVSLCTKNHLNSCVPYIAAQFLGAVVAPMDPSFSPPEMRHLLNETKPKVLFVDSASLRVVDQVLDSLSFKTEIVLFGTSTRYTEFESFLQAHPKENDFEPVKVKELKKTAVVHFSSGTTGLPKGICLSHFAMVGQSFNYHHTDNPDFELMQSQQGRVHLPFCFLTFTSLYWISASLVLSSATFKGFSRLICGEFNAEETWLLIEKYKPAALILTPVQAIELLETECSVDVSPVLSVVVIGSPLSKEYSLRLQRVFPQADLTRGYGLTELCGTVANFRGNDLMHRQLMGKPEKVQSVGVPVRGVTYRVVDPDTEQTLGFNQKGELRLKSEFMMNGYYNRDSSEAFDEGGWLKTGDIVYYDQDCCFYVVDRIKEAFKYKGWFIAPSALEEELLRHPAVRQAVVIGIPALDGCHAMGVVVVEGNSSVSEQEIEKFVEGRVSERNRLRAGVRFVDSLPYTVTGKVKRREIKENIMRQIRAS